MITEVRSRRRLSGQVIAVHAGGVGFGIAATPPLFVGFVGHVVLGGQTLLALRPDVTSLATTQVVARGNLLRTLQRLDRLLRFSVREPKWGVFS